MISMIRIRRSRTIVLPLLLFGLICFTFNSHLKWLYHPFTSASNSNSTTADDVPSSPFHPGLVDFWDATSHALVEAKPDCSLPTDSIQAPLYEFASLNESFDVRPDLLDIPQRDVDIMRDAHARFVSRIPELAPKLPYAKGTQGIVVAASGALLPVFLVSLKMLRRTGSILPVEVFMETKKQYEKEICEIVLPPMNATCMILSDVLEAVPERLEMSTYQLKSLALAFSSFEDVLLLDADNIPIEQPEHLLNSEPFTSMGFVSWPDYVFKWANTASPKFYSISSQPIPSTSSRAASEAGQLLLSKSTHAPTVLLILYYNHHGPKHYYKLLSQSPAPAVNNTKGGSRDQDRDTDTDKETYLAAAASLNATFYTVTTPIHTLGYTQAHDERFIAAGLVQHNPTDDYNYNNNNNNRYAPLVPNQNQNQKQTNSSTRPSFLHANVYKTDASSMYDVFNDKIRSQRMWGSREETLARFGGRDVEKQVWAETLYTGCHLQGAFAAWRNRSDNVCTKIGRVYKFLFN